MNIGARENTLQPIRTAAIAAGQLEGPQCLRHHAIRRTKEWCTAPQVFHAKGNLRIRLKQVRQLKFDVARQVAHTEVRAKHRVDIG